MPTATREQWIARYQRAVEEGDDETAEKIANALGMQPQTASPVEAATLGLGQGLTMGFRDEAAAGLSSMLSSLMMDPESRKALERAGVGTDYGSALTRQRRLDKRASGSPFYTGGEIAGALAMPGGSLGLMTRGASPLARVVSGAASGGAQGALAGAGYSEREGADRLGDAVLPGVAGAVGAPLVSAVAPRVVGAIPRAFQAATDTPMGRAERMIGRELVGEGMPSGQAVRSALSDLGPEGMLVDIAPGAGSQAMQRAGGAELADALIDRQAGAPARARGILSEATGADPAAYAPRRAQLEGLVGEAGAAFDELKALPVPRGAFDEILNLDTSLIRSSVRDAREAFLEETGRAVDLDADVIPLGFIQKLKEELDAVGQSVPGGPGSGVSGAAAGRAKKLSRRLRELADEGVEGYGPTRDRYAQLMGQLEALGQQRGVRGGRELFQTTDPRALDEISERVQQMDPETLADFRLGAAQSADDLIARRATATGDVGNIFRPDVEGGVANRALDIAATSPEAAARARGALSAESAMQSTASGLGRFTNSRTGVMAADVARGSDATLFGILSEQLFPSGLTRETAENMRELLARGDLDVQQLQRMIDKGVQSGLIEASPEAVEAWFRVATGTGRGILGASEE
jgi:hypothetical protein